MITLHSTGSGFKTVTAQDRRAHSKEKVETESDLKNSLSLLQYVTKGETNPG